MEHEPTPALDEITGSIAYELKETFKPHGVKVQSWDDLGDMEIKFPDGKRFRIEVIEMDGDDESNMDEDDE
jgi:hypothetical protein